MASMASSMSSMSPTSPMESDESRTWIEPQHQLSSYTAWVNSQLKKKEGARVIDDLKNDMKDGVIFADVIEIVSQQRIPGIHSTPSTYQEMRQNMDRVLLFMTQNRIKMHRISSREIVEGNLKAVMRLILALAAHYKPTSVRHSGNASSATASRHTTTNNQSVMDIAQGASAALTEARRQAKKAGKRYQRTRHDKRYQESSSEPCSDSDQSYLRPGDWRAQQGAMVHQEQRELDSCNVSASPSSGCVASPRTNLQFSDDGSPGQTMADKIGDSVDSGLPCDVDDSQIEAVKELKRQLLQLQDLILSNSPDSGVEMSFTCPSPQDMIMMKSLLQHTSFINEELREEQSRLKNECLQLQGTKAGLQQRLNEQGAILAQLKSDNLNLEIELQTVTAENISLHKQCKEQMEAIKGETRKEMELRDHNITSLRRELMRRDQMIDKLQQERKQAGVPQVSGSHHSHHSHHHHQLQSANHSKVSLNDSRTLERMAAEVSFLQDSLQDMQSLLTNASSTPEPPPLDSLEKSIICLLQNLRASRYPGHVDGSYLSVSMEPIIMKKNAEKPRLRNETCVPSQTGERRGGGVGGQGGDGPSTSVIFFADHSIQPHVCLISGRLGEIRLRDFKNLFENCEKYRYYFKSLDQEYGTVKEELTKDDAVVPGWEDKIVAWVETETGTPC